METNRIDQEWITLNAIRGMVKIASKGSMTKSTYDNSLELGGALYPELLGPENSLLLRQRESDITREFRQLAEVQSMRDDLKIYPLDLVLKEIDEFETLISIAKQKDVKDKTKTDALKKRLSQLQKAKSELEIKSHSENQLIFRDAYNADRNLNALPHGMGARYKDFELPDGNALRLRVLHPDKPEHITGADIIYERHNDKTGKISIVVVQYKIWEDRTLYISDKRMRDQLKKMKTFTCSNKICNANKGDNTYRFPCCSAFLRPTDRLQNADQKFISTGEHIPICRINECKTKGLKGAEILEYDKIKEVSLSSELFEELFNRGKIGSRELSDLELKELYTNASIIDTSDTVVIYAQEFKYDN